MHDSHQLSSTGLRSTSLRTAEDYRFHVASNEDLKAWKKAHQTRWKTHGQFVVRCWIQFSKFLPGENACWSGSKYITNFQPGFSGSHIQFYWSNPGKDIGCNREIKIDLNEKNKYQDTCNVSRRFCFNEPCDCCSLMYNWESDGQFEAVLSRTGSRLRGQTLRSRTSCHETLKTFENLRSGPTTATATASTATFGTMPRQYSARSFFHPQALGDRSVGYGCG